jgi:hypothetical protein
VTPSTVAGVSAEPPEIRTKTRSWIGYDVVKDGARPHPGVIGHGVPGFMNGPPVG